MLPGEVVKDVGHGVLGRVHHGIELAIADVCLGVGKEALQGYDIRGVVASTGSVDRAAVTPGLVGEHAPELLGLPEPFQGGVDRPEGDVVGRRGLQLVADQSAGVA